MHFPIGCQDSLGMKGPREVPLFCQGDFGGFFTVRGEKPQHTNAGKAWYGHAYATRRAPKCALLQPARKYGRHRSKNYIPPAAGCAAVVPAFTRRLQHCRVANTAL
ncbi:hypothetical protein NPIL_600131 [Nephila pilipes]|uniref:Uncharacterized protein n=1 Tax=Nephila pilipes TaxID=299642 RepID=A0A8X6UEI8_NEPPI|nr:hypothetical protein NPIL_600131 [Nephila pilipes]